MTAAARPIMEGVCALAQSQPLNVSASRWPCMSDILSLRSMRWLSRAVIPSLLVCAWAATGAQRAAAASCVEFVLDTSMPGKFDVWDMEEIRLLARISEAGRRDQVPDEVIKALIEIVSDVVDLQGVAQPGDGFRIQYRETAEGATEIAFVSLTYGCEKRTFYRFVDADGVAAYYDEKGRSARKKLLRNPVEAGLLVGRFGYREPVWTSLPTFHHGVDWWAARATPVHAAGDGVIEETRPGPDDHWLVRLRHDEAYQTQYQFATLASGVEPGQRVRQGQVIGFNDPRFSTTVHYEVLVNDRFWDPMRIRLPAEKYLHDQELANFQDEAAKIDALAARDAPFHPIYVPPTK
jgi:murein DD-endopeptidase MepM/ murein hydrolase activator NlpD